MPSAGGIEFLQSFVCNVNNECQGEEKAYAEASNRYGNLMSILTIIFFLLEPWVINIAIMTWGSVNQ